MSGASRRARKGSADKAPLAAATVVVLRRGEAGFETLMLRKNSKIAFGGMWVFPGGRVDPEDAKGLAPDDDLAIARVAAPSHPWLAHSTLAASMRFVRTRSELL